MTTPFMGSTIRGLYGRAVKAVYLTDLSNVGNTCVEYELALKFPGIEKQINEGKGSDTNPITMSRKIAHQFLMWVEKCWTMYNNLKSGTDIQLEAAIHNEMKDSTIGEIKSIIQGLKELEHPLAAALEKEIELREEGRDWDRVTGGGTSTSSGNRASGRGTRRG